MAIIWSIIATIIALGVVLALSLIGVKYEKSERSGVRYISSISANSNAQGKFILGSGTVENKNYYYYIVKTDKGYQIDKMEITNKVYIREGCNDNPFIEYTKYNATHINWFSKLFFKKEFFKKCGEIIFHVPTGTIVGNYNIDVSNL